MSQTRKKLKISHIAPKDALSLLPSDLFRMTTSFIPLTAISGINKTLHSRWKKIVSQPLYWRQQLLSDFGYSFEKSKTLPRQDLQTIYRRLSFLKMQNPSLFLYVKKYIIDDELNLDLSYPPLYYSESNIKLDGYTDPTRTGELLDLGNVRLLTSSIAAQHPPIRYIYRINDILSHSELIQENDDLANLPTDFFSFTDELIFAAIRNDVEQIRNLLRGNTQKDIPQLDILLGRITSSDVAPLIIKQLAEFISINEQLPQIILQLVALNKTHIVDELLETNNSYTLPIDAGYQLELFKAALQSNSIGTFDWIKKNLGAHFIHDSVFRYREPYTTFIREALYDSYFEPLRYLYRNQLDELTDIIRELDFCTLRDITQRHLRNGRDIQAISHLLDIIDNKHRNLTDSEAEQYQDYSHCHTGTLVKETLFDAYLSQQTVLVALIEERFNQPKADILYLPDFQKIISDTLESDNIEFLIWLLNPKNGKLAHIDRDMQLNVEPLIAISTPKGAISLMDLLHKLNISCTLHVSIFDSEETQEIFKKNPAIVAWLIHPTGGNLQPTTQQIENLIRSENSITQRIFTKIAQEVEQRNTLNNTIRPHI